MKNERLLERVEKELDAIADKGLTSSNLETTYKLIDIFKDITESCYYEKMTEDGRYSGDRRDNRYYYDDNRNRDNWDRDRRGTDDRAERYLTRVHEGMENYNTGKMRYRNGDSNTRLIEGMEMTMEAIQMFISYLMDYAETSQEKEVIRKYIDKIKNL